MKLLMLLALVFSAVASADGVIMNNQHVSNRCNLPIEFVIFYPHGGVNGAPSNAGCELGGQVDNPNAWGNLCYVNPVGTFDYVEYNGQEFYMNGPSRTYPGAACYFYNCDGDPVSLSLRCISNGIGAEIVFDITNESIGTPAP